MRLRGASAFQPHFGTVVRDRLRIQEHSARVTQPTCGTRPHSSFALPLATTFRTVSSPSSARGQQSTAIRMTQPFHLLRLVWLWSFRLLCSFPLCTRCSFRLALPRRRRPARGRKRASIRFLTCPLGLLRAPLRIGTVTLLSLLHCRLLFQELLQLLLVDNGLLLRGGARVSRPHTGGHHPLLPLHQRPFLHWGWIERNVKKGEFHREGDGWRWNIMTTLSHCRVVKTIEALREK